MRLRGNYRFLFATQLLAGVLTYWACITFGLIGIGIGFIPFLAGLNLVLTKHNPDEREMSLLHKTDSYKGIGLVVVMAIVYMYFPQYNWFFIMVSALSIIRGIVGILLFSIK